MWERLTAGGSVLAGGAYLALSLRLPLGTVERPGPGFFPLIVAVLLLSTALGFAIAISREKRRPASGLTRDARRRVIAVLAGLTGFCLLLPITGYPLAAFVFMAVMLQQLGASLLAVFSVALAGAGLSYYVFAVVLGVPLPGGPFG